jgi:hypothetical protein
VAAAREPKRVRGTPPHAALVEAGAALAVVDQASGELIAYASVRSAGRLAELVNVLRPDARQLGVLLGEREGASLLRTIELRHAAVCLRCGERIEAGERARWNTITGLVRHIRRCPVRQAA